MPPPDGARLRLAFHLARHRRHRAKSQTGNLEGSAPVDADPCSMVAPGSRSARRDFETVTVRWLIATSDFTRLSAESALVFARFR